MYYVTHILWRKTETREEAIQVCVQMHLEGVGLQRSRVGVVKRALLQCCS